MRQRRAVWVIALIVLGMVAFGGWQWTAKRAVERTVQIFLAAMIHGDADTLREHMEGAALEAYDAKSPSAQKAFAAPIPGATCKIRDVRRTRFPSQG